MTHFLEARLSLEKRNNRESGALKGLYQSTKNKSTSLLFQLSKYRCVVDGHSLHKPGSD